MQKNYGFTLAEVLITLGIVGIIVALPDGSGFSIYSLHVYFCPEYKKCEQVLKENQNKNLTVFLHKLDDYPVKF